MLKFCAGDEQPCRCFLLPTTLQGQRENTAAYHFHGTKAQVRSRESAGRLALEVAKNDRNWELWFLPFCSTKLWFPLQLQ